MKYLEILAVVLFIIQICIYTLTTAVPTTFTVVALSITGIMWVGISSMNRVTR